MQRLQHKLNLVVRKFLLGLILFLKGGSNLKQNAKIWDTKKNIKLGTTQKKKKKKKSKHWETNDQIIHIIIESI